MKKLIILFVLMSIMGCDKIKQKLPDPELAPKPISLLPEINGIEILKENPIGKPIAEKSGIVHLKFKLEFGDSIGTGFFVSYKSHKYLLTAAHNISSSGKLSIFRNNGPVEIKILKHKVNKKRDIAAFLVETKEACFELENPQRFNNIPSYGSLYKPNKYVPTKIEMFGYPDEWNFRKVDGTIYQTIKFITCEKIFVSTGECSSGMSGGPWFNKENGKIVAIHTSQLFNDASGGIPVNDIIKFLDSMENK